MSVLILENTPQPTFVQVKIYIHKRMTYGWHIFHNLTSKDIDDVIFNIFMVVSANRQFV